MCLCVYVCIALRTAPHSKPCPPCLELSTLSEEGTNSGRPTASAGHAPAPYWQPGRPHVADREAWTVSRSEPLVPRAAAPTSRDVEEAPHIGAADHRRSGYSRLRDGHG